jgi:hypothetical protein
LFRGRVELEKAGSRAVAGEDLDLFFGDDWGRPDTSADFVLEQGTPGRLGLRP